MFFQTTSLFRKLLLLRLASLSSLTQSRRKLGAKATQSDMGRKIPTSLTVAVDDQPPQPPLSYLNILLGCISHSTGLS